jgi:hypothetical protein
MRASWTTSRIDLTAEITRLKYPSLCPQPSTLNPSIRASSRRLLHFQRALKYRWLTAVCCFGLFVPFLQAQTPPLSDSPAPDYLLVVDTSFSMVRQKQSLTNIVAWLIRSGANGRMRAGESFGLWTFNEEVFTRRFPRQFWSPENSSSLAGITLQFLKGQRFEKQTRLDKAVAELLKIADTAKPVTIFIFSDGDTSMVGTPFDRSLNLIYKEQGPKARRARQPLITALVVRDGRFLGWAVSVGGQTMNIPEVPTMAPPTRVLMPSLTTLTNAASSSPILPQASKAFAESPPSVITPSEIPSPRDGIGSNASPVTPASSPHVVTPGDSEPRFIAPVPSVQPRVPQTGDPQPEIQSIELPRKATSSMADPNKARTENPPAASPAEGHAIPQMEVANSTSDQPATPSSNTAVATTQAPLAVTPAPSSKAQLFLIAGISFLIVALGLFRWHLRNDRASNRPSLISRSFERDRK